MGLTWGFACLVGTAGCKPATPCSQSIDPGAACRALFSLLTVERCRGY
jgi:hypothetical protein